MDGNTNTQATTQNTKDNAKAAGWENIVGKNTREILASPDFEGPADRKAVSTRTPVDIAIDALGQYRNGDREHSVKAGDVTLLTKAIYALKLEYFTPSVLYGMERQTGTGIGTDTNTFDASAR